MTSWARIARVVPALALCAATAAARPGGGSSFRSGSSSGSSGSSRSSGSSSGSSGSSRSSSGSSWSSSRSGSSTPSDNTPSAPAQPETIVNSYRAGDGASRAATWRAGTASLYGVPPPRPASTRVQGANERAAEMLLVSFLWGTGFVMSTLLAGAGLLFIRRRRLPSGWSTQAPRHIVVTPPREQLEVLRGADPDFSVVSFEDFVYALYAELQTARGTGRLERFEPWLGPAARQVLELLGQVPVSTVVVGSLGYDSVSVSDTRGAVVALDIEANYTETPPGGAPRSHWTREHWELRRAAGAKSRPPKRVCVFDCPSCGAPTDQVVGGVCRHCQAVVDTGEFDWLVEQIVVHAREERPPMLTGTTEEVGTTLPTRVDARLPAMLAQLSARDPSFDQRAFVARVELVFRTLQTAWSSLDWLVARAYLSGNLWHAQSYWIDAYRRSGLRNVTEQAQISRIELARVTSDRWFDAITVRIHASSLDYTLRDADGAIVGGSRDVRRGYTEYWTFIRGTAAKGAARVDAVCPNCGAPLAINAAGRCGHCQVDVTAGEFDWVLSRIEQDEVYSG